MTDYKWIPEDHDIFEADYKKNHSHIVPSGDYNHHVVKATGRSCARWLAQVKDERYQVEIQSLVKELKDLKHKVGTLPEAVIHGTDEHQWWLKDAIEAHFKGEPIPEEEI